MLKSKQQAKQRARNHENGAEMFGWCDGVTLSLGLSGLIFG
jgi:hypothetical protein